MGKVYYLCSPYSHEDPAVRQKRFEEAQRCAYSLQERGFILVEPIGSNHYKSVTFNVSPSFTYWKKTCEALIDRTDGIVVLLMDGWQESKGVQAEIRYAKSLDKEVVYMKVEDL